MMTSASGSERSYNPLISEEYEDEGTIPIDLNVVKLSYTVTDNPGKCLQMPWNCSEPGKSTKILQEVSFSAKCGKLMAIMGGSGSGKTTLLDVLANRITVGDISGHVYLNTVPSSKYIVESCCGYVRQEDRLIPFLTVKETLMFVAKLKLPKNYSNHKISDRVNDVILELGLQHVSDTNIGSATHRGLSGGERRRVSIGIQLLIQPSILLLDEPTSGLDSFNATNIIQILSKVASKKRTVLMSLHQPRVDIFNIVDVMMILSQGSIVYNGAAKEMVSYFTTLGFPCPELTNPCDFYIDIATVDNTSEEAKDESLQVVQSLHAAYLVTANTRRENGEIKDSEDWQTSNGSEPQRKRGMTLTNLLKAHDMRKSNPGIVMQFWLLLKRFFRVTIDDWNSLVTHAVEAFLMSVLLGTGFWDLKLDQNSVRDWFGLSFLLSVFYPYMVVLGLIGKCYEERKFLYFELQDKLYHPIAYYFAKVLSDIPFYIVNIFLYCIPVYFMAGLKLDLYSVTMFLFFVFMCVFTSRCLAMACATLMPSFQSACILAQGVYGVLFMSAGFLLNINSIIKETKWVSEISYLRWAYQAFTFVQVENLEFTCTPQDSQCIQNGTQAMIAYGLDSGELWTCGLGLSLNMVLFLILQCIGLCYVKQTPEEQA